MSNVVFVKNSEDLSSALDLFKFECEGQKVPLKLHMGEPKNQFFPRPDDVRILADTLRSWGAAPVLYDTTVAYNSPRNSVSGYHSVATKHGFDEIGEVIIEDQGVPIEVCGFSFEVGSLLHQSSCIVAFSHVKGHCATGMGGTIKNFGMGAVTKKSKQWMHHASRPVLDESACTYCGRCAEVCICDALSVDSDSGWLWEEWKCFGCGVCVLNCPSEALSFQKADLQYLISCAAKAALDKKKVLFVNELRRISKECDCTPDAGPLLCDDLGFVIGNDPVAVDAASLDIIEESFGRIFEKSSNVNPRLQIQYGEKIGLGSSNYTLVSL